MLEGDWVGIQHILSKGLPQDPLCVSVNGLICHFRPSLARALTLHACKSVCLQSQSAYLTYQKTE